MATLFTRPATSADSPAVSRICLLTGDKGQSAEGNFKNPEMLGLVYAEPYVNLTTTVGFVLVSKDDEDRVEKVVGYILGAPDTRAYEKEAESVWWPPLREKYPLDGEGTEHDKWFYKLIHKPDKSDQPMIDVSTTHIHIDLLPEVQRKGWGRKLIGLAVDYLKERGYRNLFVGIDPKNHEGRKFYQAIGFERFKVDSGAEYWLLDFEKWGKKSA